MKLSVIKGIGFAKVRGAPDKEQRKENELKRILAIEKLFGVKLTQQEYKILRRIVLSNAVDLLEIR